MCSMRTCTMFHSENGELEQESWRRERDGAKINQYFTREPFPYLIRPSRSVSASESVGEQDSFTMENSSDVSKVNYHCADTFFV